MVSRFRHEEGPDLNQIRAEAKALVEVLDQLTEEDKACRWTPESQHAMTVLLRRLLADLDSLDGRSKVEYRTMVRGLDMWGIHDGVLAERLVALSTAMRALTQRPDQ